MQADAYERAYGNSQRRKCIPNESADRERPNKTVDNRIT